MIHPYRIPGRLATLAGAALLMAAGLAGCSSHDLDGPYFTTPPVYYSERGSRLPVKAVSVCYSSAFATPADILDRVRTACSNPRYVGSDYEGLCTLAYPARATYTCDAVDKEIAGKEPLPPNFKGASIGIKQDY